MVAGIVAGLIVWFMVATIVNLLFRVAWPGYAEAEIATMFTLAMMVARLLLGALSSFPSGITRYFSPRFSRSRFWARSYCGAATGQCRLFGIDISPKGLA
jgi:hypothetical protein